MLHTRSDQQLEKEENLKYIKEKISVDKKEKEPVAVVVKKEPTYLRI